MKNAERQGLPIAGLGLLAVILLGFWRVTVRAPQVRPAGPHSAEIPQERTREQAERAALRRLAGLMSQWPLGTRFTVYYSYDGRHFGGHVPKTLAYNQRHRRLYNTFSNTGACDFSARPVTHQDVSAAVLRGGVLADVRARAERGPRDQR